MSSNSPLRIFIGFDDRQPVSFTALATSIYRRCTRPIAITPIILETLHPFKRRGLTPFTYSRFLVPWLCGYEGTALFLDIDMIVTHDIAELFALNDHNKAVMVSKNTHRFEWASAMLFNCGHEANKILTPEHVGNENNNHFHQIKWLDESLVGDLPREWNHLVGYDEPRDDAKLIHYTQGVPAFDVTSDSEHAELWQKEANLAMLTKPWEELMGQSVHAKVVDGKLVPKYKKVG